MAKKTWSVILPIAGTWSGEVEAETEEEAIEAALSGEGDFSDWRKANEQGWITAETFRVLVEGNLCHFGDNEATAEQIDGEDE